MKNSIVYIVHAVDTEGPLCETLEATFTRLKDIFGIEMAPSAENLRKIQNRQFDFAGQENLIAQTFSQHALNYNDTWEKIDVMLRKIMGREFRNAMKDSFGHGWVFNWHCVDHVGYEVNPRKRDVGYHKIFDHYQNMIRETGSVQDGLHFHFHPMSTYKEAHRCATSFINSPHLYETVNRRVIERNWFPKVFRAGFQTERPDSHLFLEQWIPFDISSMALEDSEILEEHQDLARGRFGDWRLAPNDWSVYQPSHDNYQLKGNCRRWIGRSLNVGMRMANIDQKEVDKAFARAQSGQPALLGISNHDWRNMAEDIDGFRGLLANTVKKFPGVQFKFCEAVEAFRSVIYGPDHDCGNVELDVKLKPYEGYFVLSVKTVKGKVFGPQPWLAVKTKQGRFIYDNFDFDTSLNSWSYTFDAETVRPDDVDLIGVAANDQYANSFVKVINAKQELAREKIVCEA